MSTGIYIITNIESDKFYIGSTVDFERRWLQHYRSLCQGTHVNPYLQHAWNKHGEERFEFGVLEYLDNQEELIPAEQFWMDIYREEGRDLYNCGLTARSPRLGVTLSEETRHKMSEAHKGKIVSEETRRKQSDMHKGVSFSEETRHRMSIAKKGHFVSKETRRKIGDKHKGKYVSEETRRKIGKAFAKSYPAFTNRKTEEIIPAGYNLNKMCREYGLDNANMWRVMTKKQYQYKDWVLQ